MRSLFIAAIVLIATACTALRENPQETRALAHDMRVEIEQNFRQAAKEAGDEELLAKIDEVAGYADIAAAAWDAYLAGAADGSDLAGALNAALDAADSLVPYIADDGSTRSLLIRASLSSLKILVKHAARLAGDDVTMAKAETLLPPES